MRLLYLDIDSQRPDHLGCYGYGRPTSPHIDSIAKRGLRFDQVFVSDAPCLPSRTALFSGRFGIHTGVVGHGGTAADPFLDGPTRGFGSALGRTSWMRLLRNAGMKTASISPFAERHAAWHFGANFNEQYNTGRRGLETADEIAPVAIDWLERNAADDNWFLHVNLWDPHTPYRADDRYYKPFESLPLPAWPTKQVLERQWEGCGPHSAREATGYSEPPSEYSRLYPKQPDTIDSQEKLRALFDGYDAGVLCADSWFGRLLETLDEVGVADETAILISADHGENLGELNIYADHMTADAPTSRVPVILHWPGVTDGFAGGHREALHYQFDVAATIAELLGQEVPPSWDGESFAKSLREGRDEGRDSLVLSQGAWTCQRSSLWREGDRLWLCMRSYHDGHHGFDDVMLFDLATDPHEEDDLKQQHPKAAARGQRQIEDWQKEMMSSSSSGVDPMETVLAEGGPKHTLGELPAYLQRLRQTGRGHWADLLEAKHA